MSKNKEVENKKDKMALPGTFIGVDLAAAAAAAAVVTVTCSGANLIKTKRV